MLQICWRTFYRRALPTCLAYGLAFAASVLIGWGLAQADPIPPASGVDKMGPAPASSSPVVPRVREVPPRPSKTEPSATVGGPEPRGSVRVTPSATPSVGPSVTEAPSTPTPEPSPSGAPTSPDVPEASASSQPEAG